MYSTSALKLCSSSVGVVSGSWRASDSSTCQKPLDEIKFTVLSRSCKGQIYALITKGMDSSSSRVLLGLRAASLINTVLVCPGSLARHYYVTNNYTCYEYIYSLQVDFSLGQHLMLYFFLYLNRLLSTGFCLLHFLINALYIVKQVLL